MNFVHDTSTAELPQVARGPIPLAQWDLWVDSGERVVMVADAPDESVKEDAAGRGEWLRGKAVEWFGSTVGFSKTQMDWLGDGRVAVRTMLRSGR